MISTIYCQLISPMSLKSIHTYEAYTEKFQNTAASDYRYFGIGICGDKKKVIRLTGSLGLLR
ncbi:DUF2000 family protein [Bacillus sonorensis]|uniref:DUF2000 family protein n=1 Tax=Bacillus sonorensis TaxID=119858 RepID=UPI00034D4677|nr:DUF2000 family protein [Bacillus sonorensis]TWK73971.1 hypothetical protein CHCC20335_2256 [Bacillus paralicheniformis]MCY8034509.1 DUF2000 domain-containing protein [Bacillus sonorensis]MCY8404406.1 DUF2000 domain-containing protein [Bacillus sonorensis]MCY8603549.1 DUF2000 domain-containing protein [Bacillus sonorensis]MCZ0069985.1 DUF2000 family protein [Bacillus sonorensis]